MRVIGAKLVDERLSDGEDEIKALKDRVLRLERWQSFVLGGASVVSLLGGILGTLVLQSLGIVK